SWWEKYSTWRGAWDNRMQSCKKCTYETNDAAYKQKMGLDIYPKLKSDGEKACLKLNESNYKESKAAR
nr:hypothetical protein [Tanacetum cinerariifolium]